MQVDTALEFDTFPQGQPIRVYLMVLAKASAAQDETKRRPLNLSLVIDRSGSMAGAKIDYTRRAAGMLVQNLGVADMLSVVLYNDTVDTLLMPEKVQRKDIISQQIQRITPSGATNLSGGWLQGCNLVSANLDATHTNRVIVISDGLANRGVTDTEKLVGFAKQKFGEGISTTTMGLGDDFNEELLMQMANAGGGAYYYIESPEVMPSILQEELTGLLKLVGQNLTITVNGPTTAHFTQMNAYPEDVAANGWAFRLGDVFGDELKALVLELHLPAINTVGEHQIASLTIEYDQLTDKGIEHRIIQRAINIRVSSNSSSDTPIQAVNSNVVEQVMLLKAAQARRKAVELADHGRFSEASQVLEAVIEEIEGSNVGGVPLLQDERESLAKQASDLSHTGSFSPTDATSEPSFQRMRKKMASQAFYTMTSRHNETVILRQRMEAPTEPPHPGDSPSNIRTKPQFVEGAPRFAQYGGHNYPVAGEEMHFGRAVENDIIINERGVSRYHCVLRRDGEVYWLEDTGSTNGTVVNGITLKGRHSIRAGDVVHIGEAKIRFHDGEAE